LSTPSEDRKVLIEPLVSWRLWTSNLTGREAYLIAMNGVPVRPFRKAESVCGNARWTKHDPFVPSLECSCGFWSYRTFKDLVNGMYMNGTSGSGRTYVLGTISNWGVVCEHERGFRSQFIYPKELIAPTIPLAKALEHTYGVSCEVANVYEMLEDMKRDAMQRARKLAQEGRLHD